MKQKFMLTATVLALLAITSSAQQSGGHLSLALPLVAEDGIRGITVSDNIDVVLIPDAPENVKVKASADVISKLNVYVVNGNLFLATTKKKEAERLAVYVWVNDLENLTLKGNSLVTSTGILHNANLHISAGKEAKAILKSEGKVWFDHPSNYQVEQRKGYSYIELL